MAISENTLAVGANNERSGATGINGARGDISANNAGAAYVFTLGGEIWRQKDYLKASNTVSVDEIDWYMALSNDTLVIGAQGKDSGTTVVNGDQEDNSVSGAGAAYAFLNDASNQNFTINAGHSGAWFNPAASGQRWLTAQGSFEGSVAEIDVFETTGGSFDDPLIPSTTKVGTMSLDFTDCSNAQLAYSLPADSTEGDIAITRVIAGSQALCEELAGID